MKAERKRETFETSSVDPRGSSYQSAASRYWFSITCEFFTTTTLYIHSIWTGLLYECTGSTSLWHMTVEQWAAGHHRFLILSERVNSSFSKTNSTKRDHNGMEQKASTPVAHGTAQGCEASKNFFCFFYRLLFTASVPTLRDIFVFYFCSLALANCSSLFGVIYVRLHIYEKA